LQKCLIGLFYKSGMGIGYIRKILHVIVLGV
jgi:hypothetical protein